MSVVGAEMWFSKEFAPLSRKGVIVWGRRLLGVLQVIVPAENDSPENDVTRKIDVDTMGRVEYECETGACLDARVGGEHRVVEAD